MKSNKKAILGMLVAMIMSLGVMGGINNQSNDYDMQYLSAVAFNQSTQTEDNLSQAISLTAASTYGGMGGHLLIGGLTIGFTPAGWICMATGAVCIL